LLVLVIVSLTTASRRAQEIYTELDRLSAHHREIESKFRRLRSDIHLSGIFIRDYLLDVERNVPTLRQRLDEFRAANLTTFSELRVLASSDGWADDARVERLQAELDEYWRATAPLIEVRTGEPLAASVEVLRTQVIPRREAILALAREIEDLNDANLAVERAEVTRRQQEFHADIRRLLWQSVLLGLVVAAAAVGRLRLVERRSAAAERQARELSQELVAAQEDERKKLSRELHDHIGQVLTALRMELGRIERLRVPTNAALGDAVNETRQLVDDMVRSVRDLALGLRPSMLDDLGLQAALEWHARDFTRRFGLPVELAVDAEFNGLPDPHRTCVYRTVQEALTNCAKHASASRIDVALSGTRDGLEITIRDNGVGLAPDARRRGLGLRGIEERVRDLQGMLHVAGSSGAGTTLTVKLPRPPASIEVTDARAAG
jgi:signal transduction histidine kinase